MARTAAHTELENTTADREGRVVDSYGVSPTQEGMLFHALADEGTGVDLEQIVCRIRGPLDEHGLVAAFHAVAARHPILRTRFVHDAEGRPRQEVLDRVVIPVEQLDLTEVPGRERAARVQAALADDRARSFDLATAPAMRLLSIDGGEEHHVVWSFHHALLDGRSFAPVLEEVFALADGSGAAALPARRPYREYIEFLERLDLAPAEAYWRERLAGFGAPTPLAVDHPPAPVPDGEAVQGVAERRLPAAGTATLRAFAAEHDVTLNTLLQAAWAIVLHRYGSADDVCFGATRACRRSAFPDGDAMVGLFINTLPVRVRLDPSAPLGTLLARVREAQLAVRPHEHTPLARVQAWSEVPRGRPLFETLVVYDDATLDARLRHLDPDGTRRFAYHGQTNYPVTVVAYGDERLLVRVEHDRRRVDDDAAQPLLDVLLRVLERMPEHGDRPLRELAREPEPGHAAQVARVAVTECLHERFARRARETPDAPAATCDGQTLSYAQLDRRANALAWRLRDLGVQPDTLVGLRVERGLDVVAGILGILKAGGAYVPLDPAYPAERVRFMVADSGVDVVVAQRPFAADFGADTRLVLADELDDEAAAPPPSPVGPGHLAYVMYTSGSTGRPKGVMVTHANVMRLFGATDHWFGFGPDDVWTVFHSYAFDFSVWELWGALLHGGRAVVVPYWVSRSPDSFCELVRREGVTVLNQTPSAFRQFIAADAGLEPAATPLRHVIFGGEALEFAMLRPWFERHGDDRPRLVNMYGITETTVHVTYRPVSAADARSGSGSMIGVPIPDLRIAIVGTDGHPVPDGVPGEMLVGGAGVTRGYHNRPELTAERFPPDPEDAPHRLYRTGDLARRTRSGDLQYLGRIDAQVKIRGFRIELGEIEAALAEHPSVAHAACAAQPDPSGSDRRLVAYLVAQDGQPIDADALKAGLQRTLPGYMVPAHYVEIPELPLTPNGKLDRTRLPAPDYRSRSAERDYTAPRTPTETALAEVWAAVLGVPRVGVDDDFFALGGDSILTIQVIARCRQLGLRFTPRDLARRPTIGGLAEVVEVLEAAVPDPAPASTGGAVEPTPIQRWFLAQRLADPDHWNQAFLFEVPAGLDTGRLEQALAEVVRHHEALGLRVDGDPGAERLRHDPDTPAPSVARIELAGVAPEDRPARIEREAGAAQAGLDLRAGPLVAAVHFDCGDSPGRLLLAVHHLAVDGVSWRILREDLESAYDAMASDAPVALPARSDSFARWSLAVAEYARRPAVRASLEHWRAIEAVDAALPDGPRDGGPEAEARTVRVALDAADTDALLHKVPRATRTQINDVLLCALALALRDWTGRDAHRVEVEGHGREDVVAPLDLSRTVGWFTSLYPVALDLAGADDEVGALKRVKQALRTVPDRGLSYGALRYGAEDPDGHGLGARPAELLFNYLGQFDQVVAGSERFGFAEEPTGPWHGPANARTHRFEVLARIRDGRFEVVWTYGAGRDRAQAVEALAERYLAALRAVIRRCVDGADRMLTPADLPLARLDQAAIDTLTRAEPDLEDAYALSPMQRLFLSMEGGDAQLGLEQWVFRLRGALEPDALRTAWEATVRRHAALRTSFRRDADEPLQVVHERVTVPWEQEDWRGRDPARRDDDVRELLRADAARGFDLGRAPLLRLMLVRVAGDEHLLVWSTHHLYVDGWSWPLVFADVAAAYEARADGRPAAPCQYRDYIGWLAEGAPDSRAFWQARLAGFTAPTPVGFDAEAGAEADGGAADIAGEVTARLDAATSATLTAAARAARVTLNTVVQGAWALLLGHLDGGEEVVFGAAFSGRPPDLPGVETMVGPCVNNLPVRVRLDPEERIGPWLARLHEDNLELAQHQYAALTDIQAWAGVPWRLRLFDSLVVFQNYLVGEGALHWGPVAVEPMATPQLTNYPLTLTVTPGEELAFTLRTRGGAVAPAALAALRDGLAVLLTGLAEAPESGLGELMGRLPAATRGAARRAAAAAAERRAAAYVAPAGEMERTVAAIWAELFALDQVGVESNFFDLGGHSLLLVRAHALLRERVRGDLPIVALLQYPTVRALARYLTEGASAGAGLDAVRDRAALQRQAMARRRTRQGRR